MRPHGRKRSVRGRAAPSSPGKARRGDRRRPGDRRRTSRARQPDDRSDLQGGLRRSVSRTPRARVEGADANSRRMVRGSRSGGPPPRARVRRMGRRSSSASSAPSRPRLASAGSTRAGRPRRATTNVWPNVRKLLDSQPWDSLEPHVLKAGANPHEVIPTLRRYAELVLDWNRSVSNLISKNDEARIVSRHLAESLEPAHLLRSSGARRWIDFGSGAGLPAVPLSIAGIGERWALVESRRPKALFLRRLMMDMGLRGIDTVHSRLETLTDDPSFVSAFDGVTSRATLALGPTLTLAARFVRTGGVAFLWKGSGREREMLEDSSWREWWDFDGILGAGSGNITVARFTRT